MNYHLNPYAFPYLERTEYEAPNQPWHRQIDIINAINIALQQIPGEVVEAELESRQGRQLYEIDIVTANGSKYEVNVDRETGDVMRIEPD